MMSSQLPARSPLLRAPGFLPSHELDEANPRQRVLFNEKCRAIGSIEPAIRAHRRAPDQLKSGCVAMRSK